VSTWRSLSPFGQRLPFAGLLLAAIGGILASDLLDSAPIISLGILLCGAIFFLFLRDSGATLAIVFAAFALVHSWNWQEAPSRLLGDLLASRPDEVEVRGVIAGLPSKSSTGSVRFPLKVERIADSAGGEITEPVLAMVNWKGAEVSYGDEVEFTALAVRPDPPRNPGAMDYRSWLARRGMHMILRVDPAVPGAVLAHDRGHPVIAFSLRAREAARRILSIDLEGAPDVIGTIQGICLGITDGAPEGFTEEFRFTGTMHLFAVSGLHVGMVALILWFLLMMFRVPRSVAVALSVCVLFFYVTVTGCKDGSLRAATMVSLLMLGLVFFRRSPPVNTLAAAAFLQLAFDTNTLFSTGWQFSYAVVLAILLLEKPIRLRISGLYSPDPFLPQRLLTRAERFRFEGWREFSGLAAVSFAAWVGAILPTAVYFHLLSVSALGANLLAVPAAFAVLSLGMLALIGGSFSPWVAGAFNNANWLVAKALILIVRTSALIPGGHWFLGVEPDSPRMSIPDLGGASCALIQEGWTASMLDAGRRGDAVRTILPMVQSMGVNRITDLVISRSDARHLGGVPILAAEIGLGTTFLPPDHGRSPTARSLFASLRDAKHLQSGSDIDLSPHSSLRVLLAEGDRQVLRLMLGDLSILWLSDGDPSLLAKVANLPEEALHAEILYLPLGGVSLDEGSRLIRRISPSVLISPSGGLGRNNSISSEWASMLRGMGISLFRQDQTGAVILKADPKNPTVRSWLPSGPERTIRIGNRETPAPH